MTTKSITKKLTPPIFLDLYRYLRQKYKPTHIEWSGNYRSWQEAMKHCQGYDSPNILEKCKNALLKVKNGDSVYERDSVLFDEIHYSFPLLATLQRAAIDNNGKLCVLDFGGSLGSSYFQNKAFLNNITPSKWCIVEQANFVECGKQYFEDEQLKFYYTIEDCLKEHKPTVLLLSGVLQCLEKPYYWIETFIKLEIPYILIDRTTFVGNKTDILTIQKTPLSIYEATYPTWFFNFEQFQNAFLTDYSQLLVFDSFADVPIVLNGNKKASWKGLVFKKK
jgi:putative methyltransferase (TIGR04325 family)